jgi:hypothetical protein
MVAKKETALNKTEAIRSALTQYPDKGPAEIARMLTQEHGIAFRGKAVSSIKTRLRRNAAPARKPAAPVAAKKPPAQRPRVGSTPPATTGGVAAMVTNLQAYIQRLGKQDLHRLIDTL